MRRSLLLVAFALALRARASAADASPSLQIFPAEILRAYAPLLTHGEMALIEPDPAGFTRQLTLLAWVPAPPEVVRTVVLHPERYPQFIHNVSRSDVEYRPDGTLVNRWRIQLPIGHFDDVHELRPAPEPTGPIDVRTLADGRREAFRWEFLRAAGGGTVLVHYGHYDNFRQNALLARLLARNPAYEAGMAISAGLVLVKAIQREATRVARAAGRTVALPRGAGPGFKPLLARGTLAVLRSDPSGGLVDVSVVERVPARPELFLDVVRRPELWPSFLPSVTHCEILSRDTGSIDYRVGVAGIIVDVEATFRMRFLRSGVDALAVAGDVPGSRYRWDLQPDGDATLAVYRTNAQLGKVSGILRLLFRFEPTFEHSANVAVGVIVMRAMAWRAKTLARLPQATPAGEAPRPAMPPSSAPPEG